ncbi:hypothetical protein APA_417 [Pseudanabaena sp. lw0831]|uniref:hypothetical protein n=1 Tax=Pseudanabaena sp. lw0831 TaxID=1357935 RepID=UPI001914E374|nr:hypothetical protein [Pseudanabaena sp. lw0831]GBO52748.1 hypothetical protein APA_417 [Pseudanabaena sp. lw0831]
MKNKLWILTLVVFLVSGCSSIAKGVGSVTDDAARIVTKVDPPPLPKVLPNTNSASVSISNFIKQAGKSKGSSYIGQQVSNRKPISTQSLANVIFSETVSELRKIGKKFIEREVRQLAYAEAVELINEYNSQNNNKAEVTR